MKTKIVQHRSIQFELDHAVIPVAKPMHTEVRVDTFTCIIMSSVLRAHFVEILNQLLWRDSNNIVLLVSQQQARKINCPPSYTW